MRRDSPKHEVREPNLGDVFLKLAGEEGLQCSPVVSGVDQARQAIGEGSTAPVTNPTAPLMWRLHD
jgi:hypothetical protein